METIDVTKMNPLFTYVSNCIKNHKGISFDVILTIDNNIKKQLAQCLKVLCSYENKPEVLTELNCDLWWNVVICTDNDFSIGSMYGYSRKTCIRVCKLISKYLIWFIAHLKCEVMWIHSNLKNVLTLISKKIYNKKDLLYTFKTNKDCKDISFISKEDWVKLLYQTGIYSINGAKSTVTKKFTLKEETQCKNLSLTQIMDLKTLVYS